MDYYDPWVSGLLAEADYKAELRQVAKTQLARQALDSRAARPSKASAWRERRHMQQLFNGLTGYSRLLFRRLVTKAR